MQLSVIIVNYNVRYFLEQCLCSVEKAIVGIQAEVWVVDNASTDSSQAYFENRFPFVQFIWNKINVGFGKANNQALQKATGNYILFLNPDTIVPADAFSTSINYMQQQPNMGGLGVRMIDGSGTYLPESKRGFPSPFTSLCKLSGLTALFPTSALFARYYLGHLNHQASHVVDVLAGAYMMVPKKVLDITGGFDEAFFMYGEDVDLSYRIQQAGFQNHYCATVCIVHFKGESTKRGSLNYVKLFYGAMTLFVQKHYNSGLAKLYRVLIQGAIFVQATFAAIKRLVKGHEQPATLASTDKAKVWLLVTDKLDSENLQAAITKQPGKNEVTLWLDTTEESTDITLLSSISSYLHNHHYTDICFNTSCVSLNSITQLMQQLPPSYQYWFYAAGANSMLSSGDKNATGAVLLVEGENIF